MSEGRRSRLSVLVAVGLAAAVATFAAERAGLIRQAHAQSDADKRKEGEKHKAAPSQGQQPPKTYAPPPPKAMAPPPRPMPPATFQKPPPSPQQPAKQFQQQQPPATWTKPAAPLPETKKTLVSPEVKKAPLAPDAQKETLKKYTPPPSQQVIPKGPPPTFQKGPPPVVKTPTGPVGPATVQPQFAPGGAPGRAPKHFGDIQKGRIERIEDGRKVIQEPDNRFIVKQGNRTFIRHDETERFLRRPDAKSERRADGNVETFYVRPDGARIVSVVDAHGRLLRRYRRDRDGREHNLIDNRRFYRNVGIGVGIGVLGIIALNLPPPRVTIPYDQYIVDYDSASDDDLYETLDAPPIEDPDRAYSLEEIRDNYELRARVRSIDITTVTFEFGSWEIPPDQYYRLERVARAILRVLRDNPDAVFMVAGNTDAVGSEEDNLSLSDRRASAVADVLSNEFGVPPENLVTQGYGEQFLKVDTQEPEPRNRRVSILNITGLMAER